MNKRDKTKSGYAAGAITWWWHFWLGVLPFIPFVALGAAKEGADSKEPIPLWSAIAIYIATILVQELYFRFAPTMRQARRVSRRFMVCWWGILALFHSLILYSAITGHYLLSPILILAVISMGAHYVLDWVWAKDLEGRIFLNPNREQLLYPRNETGSNKEKRDS